MSAQHTPGPWHLTNVGQVRDASGSALAVAQNFPGATQPKRGVHENKANARLIAAAPELLEQVELFVRCLEYEINVSERKGDNEGANLKRLTLHFARAAITKARGQ